MDEIKDKKILKSVIFDPFGESPIKTIWSKICVAGGLHGVIKCAKFQIEIHKGYGIAGGVGDFWFPCWFLDGPYNSAPLMRSLGYPS